LLNEFEPEIEAVSLLPSDGGRFEVKVNEKLIYSKLATGRFAQAGEVQRLVRSYLQEGQK
jgi:selenoprotein W-related protein